MTFESYFGSDPLMELGIVLKSWPVFCQENGCQLSLMAVVIYAIAAFGCIQYTVTVKVAYHVIFVCSMKKFINVYD